MYILKEEKLKNEFGVNLVYNVYYKLRNEEIFDCSFNNKEKAEKYIKAIN